MCVNSSRQPGHFPVRPGEDNIHEADEAVHSREAETMKRTILIALVCVLALIAARLLEVNTWLA